MIGELRESSVHLDRDIIVAADMHGCPNRCRHCYLGRSGSEQMTTSRLREAAMLFRTWRRKGAASPFFREIKFSTWAREPDYAANYRDLYALECELSDGPPARYELLSVWRLARDARYAPWARSIGTQKCQISFFGVGSTQDWFCRRRGAFADSLMATERLLNAGIMPRWQVFVTKKLLPDVGQLLELAQDMRIRERCETMGMPWELFCHLPGPDGEARAIEWLRPTAKDVAALPSDLLVASQRYLGRDTLWRSERELLQRVLHSEPEFPYAYHRPSVTGFYLLPSGDVYSNWGTLEPWWRMGNLDRDGLDTIMNRYRYAEAPAMQTIHRVPAGRLALRYGDMTSQRLYGSEDGLLCLYLARYCEEEARSAEV